MFWGRGQVSAPVSTSFTFPSIRSSTRAVQGMVLNLASMTHLELLEIMETGWIKGSLWVWLIQKWWKENWHEIGKTVRFGRWCLELWLSSRMPHWSPQAVIFSIVVARESMATKKHLLLMEIFSHTMELEL